MKEEEGSFLPFPEAGVVAGMLFMFIAYYGVERSSLAVNCAGLFGFMMFLISLLVLRNILQG